MNNFAWLLLEILIRWWKAFGIQTSDFSNKDEKTTVRALTADWYTSEQIYELERRAIFSKKWCLITHKLRLDEPGKWLQYIVGGFPIVLTCDRTNKIRGFHNVCRHRAFPVVTGDQGSSRIFSCKYHGWSYALDGKLTKAPGYQEIESFDKTKNGLFPIHVHVDEKGFIWVNLDGKNEPEVAWEDDFKGVDTQQRYEGLPFDDYIFDHCWEMEGSYNWKLLADNYNECYHCAANHPDIPALADLNSYAVVTNAGHIQHQVASTPEQVAVGLKVAPTYFFPNASLNITPHFFFIQRFEPRSPTKSIMRYEVYRNKNSSDADFQRVNQMYKRIMSEDKDLCAPAQKNIGGAVFISGELHPRLEKGPIYFQKLLRKAVEEHHQLEERAMKEIWPAQQVLPSAAALERDKDIKLCSGMACSTNLDALAW